MSNAAVGSAATTQAAVAGSAWWERVRAAGRILIAVLAAQSLIGAIVLLGGVMFSFTPLIFRGLESTTDWQFLVLRGGAMVAVLLMVVYLRRSRRPVRFDNVTWRTWLAAVLMAAMSALFVLALARTTAAMVTFLLAAAPVSGALFGWLVMRERVTSATAGFFLLANAMPSRTVPVVQLPQWP